ncbi:hypothetical protein F3Y22_tig00110330pilonHSYRG00024 [Hibiscus syriacus]|uniref:RecA-like C-terminal domain-containing protein n=1 Tax=Hibiscus syriacus TaxID=106335 RepID=A0A6A3B2A1_HIBSY|nr:hypothetical protein F3Y22_tig00110330pilonHSYRG00024 [Hibiscus syriacus]
MAFNTEHMTSGCLDFQVETLATNAFVSLPNLATKHKLVTKSVAIYSFNDKKFHGKEAFKRYLAENGSALEELVTKLREKLLDGESKKESQTDLSDDNASKETISFDTTDEEAVAAIEA